ncbi:HNH endonuclease [Rhodococcus sp. 14-2686-1-2]|nr:HNH endonuclease [Rhodococcus sp. 15-1189-1-1a]OZF02529.1 HNH endonuclease [Rhodococcus sp. 15-1154-1]OZF12146.1 HNH endonuclease [Rhodococcus sp. 14-2686-1-2]
MKKLRVALLLLVAALAMTAFGSCDRASIPGFSPPPPAPGSPTRVQIEDLLARVQVVADRPDNPGYERGCKSGEGCVFGPAWTDDYDGPGGHDGCGTRDNVLALSLTEVTFRDGTRNCVVTSGVLADPYSGESVEFVKADAGKIQIDHVYPLSAAWDMGANAWTPDKRVQFANDIDFNLLAVNGPDNQSKSDSTPAQWLPPNAAYRCFYAGKYLSVAAQYALPITQADQRALSSVAQNC